jgi:hypothetical protein
VASGYRRSPETPKLAMVSFADPYMQAISTGGAAEVIAAALLAFTFLI